MDIIISGLRKAYGEKTVLRDFSCIFPEGRISCVSGRSGSGKSTLLRILAGLEQADSGSIQGLSGKTRVSCVFQENRLFANMSAEKNVMLTARKGFSVSDARELLRALEIFEPAQAAYQFSGGMQRRIAVARALAADYELLLLDEPFAGLDAQTRAVVNRVIQKMTVGKTVIYAGHFPEAVENAALSLQL